VGERLSLHDILAHVLQLCEYLDSANTLTDLAVIKEKAAQVRKILMETES